MEHVYYVYILTNSTKKVLYVGLTNDLEQRVMEHYLRRGNPESFVGRYSCFFLVYYEEYKYIDDAIEREKEIKKWSRKKKNRLVETMNPEWQFLNVELYGSWPPTEKWVHRGDD